MRDLTINLRCHEALDGSFWVEPPYDSIWCKEEFREFFPKFPYTATKVKLRVSEKKPKGIPHDRCKRVWVTKSRLKSHSGRKVTELQVSQGPFVFDKTYNEWLPNLYQYYSALPLVSDNPLLSHFRLNTNIKVWLWYEVEAYDHEARYAHPGPIWWSR
jgi:hypothetical protein